MTIPTYEGMGKGMMPHKGTEVFSFLSFREWIRVI
jgi:hypothetical protein